MEIGPGHVVAAIGGVSAALVGYFGWDDFQGIAADLLPHSEGFTQISSIFTPVEDITIDPRTISVDINLGHIHSQIHSNIAAIASRISENTDVPQLNRLMSEIGTLEHELAEKGSIYRDDGFSYEEKKSLQAIRDQIVHKLEAASKLVTTNRYGLPVANYT